MGGSTTRRTTAVIGAGLLLAAAGCSDSEPPALETAPPVTLNAPSTLPTVAPSPTPAPDAVDPDDDTDDDSDDDSDDAVEAEDDTSADEPDGGPGAFPKGTSPAVRAPGGAQLLTVTDVRVGSNDGFDRVVFELDGKGTPGWNVEYVDAAFDDGSGEPVEVDGDAILSVRIRGTAMPADSGVEEYDGTTLERADRPGDVSVEEVVYRHWFEGYTTAFIGVEGGPKPFRVFALDDPVRVVVDVKH